MVRRADRRIRIVFADCRLEGVDGRCQCCRSTDEHLRQIAEGLDVW